MIQNRYYESPRLSGELADCSMPMTFDQYSICGFRCLYCFSQFQRGLSHAAQNYYGKHCAPVKVETVKRLFLDTPDGNEFSHFIRNRVVMQWGGLSDPFCPLERKHGIGLELLRFFKEINYPLCFSTKGTWWTQDPRYVELFRGQTNWNVKISIITLDAHKAQIVERGVDLPEERLRAMERVASWNAGGVTLRLRPFIIGISTPQHTLLIHKAAQAGATALSTEFMCLDQRCRGLRKTLPLMDSCAGFDLLAFYRTHSLISGYLRLNRDIKRPYVNEMEEACKAAGIRFYVSDAHFKERCANGSCCGLNSSWNYSRGQFCEALQICKIRGKVRWSDIEQFMGAFKNIQLFNSATNVHRSSSESAAQFRWHTIYEYLRWLWNTPSSGKSPYRMFEGIMRPVGLDEEGNVIYEYDRRYE